MSTTQKKTSFSELSSLLQSPNHTLLRHSRQSSLKNAKNLYTVPEVRAESSSPISEDSKPKGSRYALTSSSHQLLNSIRNKKQSKSQCLIYGDQKQTVKVVLNREAGGEPLRKTLSNPINRYEYQKTYTTRPKSSSVRCIPTVNRPKQEEPVINTYSSKNSPLSLTIDVSASDTMEEENPIKEEYTLDNKFGNQTDDSNGVEENESLASSNQSPLTKTMQVEADIPISRRDSITLEKFSSDLNSNEAAFNSLSRIQMKLNYLRKKPSTSKSTSTAPDDLIALFNVSTSSSLSGNSLSPQKDNWKVTAQGKFWLNSDLSTSVMSQELNLQYRMIGRLNYNNGSPSIDRIRNLISKKKIVLNNYKEVPRGKVSANKPAPKNKSITLENFVSINALTEDTDFAELKDQKLRCILTDGKKQCEEIWLEKERHEFVSYEPICSREDHSSLALSVPTE